MRFFRRFAGMLGFGGGRDEVHDSKDEDDHDHNSDDLRRNNRSHVDPIPAGPRKGFSVPVQVPVERQVVGPLLVPCNGGDGGVQGLRWYGKRLRIDEDGDVADEFLHEVVSLDKPSAVHDQPKPFPRFQVKHIARHAKVKNQMVTSGGKLKQCVESQGRLQWV